MTARIERLKEEVLQVKGVFVDRQLLWTESYRETERDPIIIRQAKAFAKLLEGITIEIGDEELIVGRHPKREPSAEEQEKIGEAEAYWQGRTIYDKAQKLLSAEEKVAQEVGLYSAGGMTGHMSLNNEKVLELGLVRISEEVENKLKNLDLTDSGDQEKVDFYRAALITLKAGCHFAERYVEEARRSAERENDPRRKRELERIAEVCERTPAYPARTFQEALQAAWFLHLLVAMENGEGHACFCPGRVDRFAYPFYKSDIEKGIITQEEAQELLEAFLIKFNEFDPIGTPQVLMIGGQNPDGSDSTNALSFMCLDACEKLRLIHPALAMSWHSKISEEFMTRACQVIKTGIGFPAIFNDEVIVPSLLRSGASSENACYYVPGSCVEISVIGKTNPWVASGYINFAKCLELALNDGVDPLTGKRAGISTGKAEDFQSFEELWEAYKKQIAYAVKLNVQTVNLHQRLWMECSPYPFLSCLIDDCLEKGKDITAGGAKYNFTEPEGVGMPNSADSLIAIKKLVFEERSKSLSELKDILAKNFEGFESFRQFLINRLPKYGNDIDEVDEIAKGIAHHFYSEVERYTDARGGKYRAGFLCWIMHSVLGRLTSATLDGRRAREVLADSIGPVQGRDRNGPTAVIKSATKFDHIPALGGLVLNLKFSPSIFSADDGIKRLSDLIKTYLYLKGFEVQINVIDKNTLLEAKRNPEAYRNLIVRVAGYSAYYTSLDPALQDEIIARTEHN